VGKNREYGRMVFTFGRKLNKIKDLLLNTYTSRDFPLATEWRRSRSQVLAEDHGEVHARLVFTGFRPLLGDGIPCFQRYQASSWR
jgi:hypothetical protein